MSGTITPSPNASYSTAPLGDTERADVRRFCGYPAYGTGPGSGEGQRFYQAFGAMEYRMTNLQPAELQIVRGKLTELYTLDTAIAGAGANLDTEQAAVWKHNAYEVRDRVRLFNARRRSLCAFLAIPAGPDVQGAEGVRVVIG